MSKTSISPHKGTSHIFFLVTPVDTGVQYFQKRLDSLFRGNDFLKLLGKPYLLMAYLTCLFFSLSAPWPNPARAQEEKMPELIETFTLDAEHPRKEFFGGKMKVELVSSTVKDYMRTVEIRVSSDMLKAEYNDEWQKHTFIEMTDYYVGDPVSGSPFKCLEGWMYYKKSSPGSVTLALHAGTTSTDSWGYWLTVKALANWKYFIMFLCYIALAVFLYYYTPLFWGFISMQIQARAHALATGFDSSTVLMYVLTKVPLLICFYIFFHLFFNYDWKGVVAAALIGIGLQFYFNWHNKNQLIAYAEARHFTPAEGTNNRAYTGMVLEKPVLLSVGGMFIPTAYSGSDFESTGWHTFMSYILIQVTLKNKKWEGLVLEKSLEKPYAWTASQSLEHCPDTGPALAALSRLPKYTVLKIEVLDGKLSTVKAFAPDSPAEIHLLTDLMVDLAGALEKET